MYQWLLFILGGFTGLAVFFCAQPLSAEETQPESALGHFYHISGEVKKGEKFSQPIVRDLVFELVPADGGWDISVKNKFFKSRDFVWVATPPYRFDNPRYIRSVRKKDGQQSVALDPHVFYFVLNIQDFEKFNTAIPKVLWPAGEFPEEVAAARLLLEGTMTPQGTGKFLVTDSSLSGDSDDIASLQFKVDIFIPMSAGMAAMEKFKAAYPGENLDDVCSGHLILPSVLQKAYTDLTADGVPDTVVSAQSCLAGTGGADVFGIYSIDNNGKILELPVDNVVTSGGKYTLANFRGKLGFEVRDNQLIRTLPIYKGHEPNCCPEGGVREVSYQWNGRRFVVANVTDLDEDPQDRTAQSF